MEVSIKEEPLDWTPEVSEVPADDPLSDLPLPSIFSPETQEKPPKELNDKQLASLTCQFCNKLFTHRSNVLKHVRAVHKKVRYQCAQCLKIFNQESTLKNHVKTIHEGIQHKCDLCDKDTSNQLIISVPNLKNQFTTSYDVQTQ